MRDLIFKNTSNINYLKNLSIIILIFSVAFMISCTSLDKSSTFCIRKKITCTVSGCISEYMGPGCEKKTDTKKGNLEK